MRLSLGGKKKKQKGVKRWNIHEEKNERGQHPLRPVYNMLNTT